MCDHLVSSDEGKDKSHLCIQSRQDQVYPSENSEISQLEGEDDNNHGIGNSIESSSRVPNGDRSLESWRGIPLHGMGKNLLSDGCIYEGEWEDGKLSGRGKIIWPSGATYEGDFWGGYLHGVGTYNGANGTTYKGDWRMNVRHGLGRKLYANGDVYQGSWNQGKQEGPGRYVWVNGNVYMGDWKGGKMCGKGTLTWVTGDSFTGNWLNGLEHGQGILKWADGGFYIGTWSKGLKDGKGVFYPPGTKPPGYLWLRLGFSSASYINEEVGSERSRNLSRASSSDIAQFSMRRSRQRRASSSDHKESTGTFLRKSESLPMRSVTLEKQRSMEGVIERVFGFDSGSLMGFSRDTILEDEDEPIGAFFSIVEREYAQGVLISEFIKDSSFTLSKSERRRQRRQVKEIKRPGETIIKGHRSYDLMLNLQLGIRYTVGKISPEQRQEIGNSDFAHKSRILVRFPREGSQLTPPHQSVDFTWKDYCPMVFRNLRQMFKIDAADYMMSICGNDALRELSSPGKSRCIFFLSNDDRFMIKTLRKPEVKVLLRMLPSYYIHVHKHENTLITKFFGLHRVKPLGGRKVRFVVMGNMFYTELRIHRRFDIKGSLQGRSTDKIEIDETTTLKDLDLDFVFYLEPTWREALLKQIEVDCDFLESQRIMDYSLLLGLHFRAPQFPKFCSKNAVDEGASSDANGIIMDEDWTYPRGLVLVAHEPKEKTLRGPHVRGKPLKAGLTGHEEVDLLLPGAARLMIQLGVNMPARADRTTESEDSGMTYDVVLYLGIIDILQEYNIVKKIEHTYKSLQFDSVSISAVDPHLYSERFQDCIRKIFPPNPS